MEITIFEKLDMWWSSLPQKDVVAICIIVPICWVITILLYQLLSAVIENVSLLTSAKIEIWKFKKLNNYGKDNNQ